MGGSIRERVYLLREWIIEQKRQLIVPFLILCLYGLSIGINMYRYTQGRFSLYPGYAGKVLLVAKCFVGIAEVSFGLILLPVSRGLVTWLRSTWLRHIIDFDCALNLHAWLAGIGIAAGTVHGVCATVAYINIGRLPFDMQAAVGRVPKDVAGMLLSWNILSGCTMFLLACLTFPFAFKWPRQAPWLKDTKLGRILNNADYFWITHHILIIVWLPVAIMHSIKWTPGFIKTFSPAFQLETTKFAYYIAAPLIIYLFNRLQRIATASHLALVVDAGVVGGDVLALKLLKPRFFDHKPGQYLFLCCPKISPYEWHPFTITSSPQDKFVSVHIKRAGDWTGALHDLFKPAGRSYSVGGGTCPTCPSLAANNSMQLLTAAADSAVPPTSSRGIQLSDEQQQDAGDNQKATPAADSTDAISVVTRRRPRVSVDIAARFGDEAVMHPARARRSSAPGFKSSDTASEQVNRELSGTAVGAPIAKALNRNANNLLAGAWDPRAERVIVEAEERLKQAVTEIADRRRAARCSCPGSLEPAFAAFSAYRPSPADRDSASGANGRAVVAKKSVGFSLEGANDNEQEEPVWVPPLLYIDGPFGAPTQDFEHYKVVVLVGTGIGITPMASVLRSLMHDLYDARCENCGTVNRRLCRMMQNKVYVHWVTRSLEGMAWFQDLLASISNLDVDRVFQFNVHITQDTRSGAGGHKPAHGSQVMPEPQELLARKAVSLATGSTSLPGCKVDPLPVNYSYARPDMRKTLQEVQDAHRSEYVGVFFCGPRVMGQQVQRACRKLNAAANERANQVAMDPEAPACPRPCRLCFHEEIF